MKNIVLNNISTSYFITADGKCYNSITNKYLVGQENYKNHYYSYNLTLPDGSKKRCYAHRLVAEAFLPKPSVKHTEVNHIDGNVLNNCVDNLEWVTPKENQQHAIRCGLRHVQHIFCFDQNKKLVAEYLNIHDAAAAVGICESIIAQELQKTIKSLSGNFYWSTNPSIGETKNYVNTGKSKSVNQYDRNGKFIMNYPSTGIAAKAIGANASHIGECCRGKIKTYKNFIWRYTEDIVSTSGESQRGICEIL